MNENRFKVFYIPKKSGYRKIITYKVTDIKLRSYHQKINSLLYRRVLPSKFAKAFIKNRSIIKNAKSHMYNDIFITFDIKDFFPNINHNWLIEKLYYEINLNHKRVVSKSDCTRIVDSCSVSKKGLAVGLIPSPFLANIYLKDFDNILYGNLRKLDLKNVIYTRYADDLTISYKANEPILTGEIESIVCGILSKFGLQLNKKKTRIIDINRSNHVKITGLNIYKMENDYRKLSVGRKRKDDLYRLATTLAEKDASKRQSYEINRIKGLQSFILSIEGNSYEQCYSPKMISVVNTLGFKSLKDLIDSMTPNS